MARMPIGAWLPFVCLLIADRYGTLPLTWSIRDVARMMISKSRWSAFAVAESVAFTPTAIFVVLGSHFGDCSVKRRVGVAFRSQQDRNSQSNC
ncbi:hypothetical protein [Bradyrhizobium sp. SZCCHNS3053]|uniref:hypothetical protein n=1 Tax=Bradyrhizobium sp. SZCCHNS3053 TaxID=3057322 RepID=UPI0029168767|nr:hypothetical protein [Bradyrhizobium sp. SZCCHNS3053]